MAYASGNACPRDRVGGCPDHGWIIMAKVLSDLYEGDGLELRRGEKELNRDFGASGGNESVYDCRASSYSKLSQRPCRLTRDFRVRVERSVQIGDGNRI